MNAPQSARRLIALTLCSVGLLYTVGCSSRSDMSDPGRGGGAREGTGAPMLTVYAASSLTDVLETLGARYTRETGQGVKFSFASTGLLARQIEAGAKADLFFSADLEWMDYLDERRLIEPGTRRELLGNRLVLIAPADSPVELRLEKGAGLATALSAALGPRGRLALADPDGVPAGRYAKAALQALGVWPEIERRLARAENVRAAMRFVARGEAALGVVFRTDAQAEPRVRIVDTFSESLHPPIRYSLARVRGAPASKLEAWLTGAEARTEFEQAQFVMLAGGAAARSLPRDAARP